MSEQLNDAITRSVILSSSLHFHQLSDYRAAGDGEPIVSGQLMAGLGNSYGIQGNPTNQQLQAAISKLEQGDYSLLYPSGLSALTAVQAFLKSGDHWLLPDSVYGPMRRFANYLKDNHGIDYDIYDPLNTSSIEPALTSQTKVILIETPGSITFDVADVSAIVSVAKDHNLITVADNTWASSLLYKPLTQGFDVSIVALTKYAAGYSDLFMGSVTTVAPELYKTLAYHHKAHGHTVSPVSSMLVLRGLETLSVRLQEHGRRAGKLIEQLQGQSGVRRIFAVDPTKDSDFSGRNGLVSIELERQFSDDELQQLFDSMQIFTIGESWGGTRSLVLPYQTADLADRRQPPAGTIIRFHVGLEDKQLITNDISAFLKQLDAILHA